MLNTDRFIIRFILSVTSIFFLVCLGNANASDLNIDTKTGQELANKGNDKGAVACITCHGANGEGNPAAGFPRLAGLNADYLTQQIKNFQTGKRQNAVMLPTARALSAEETQAVSHYFAALNAPATVTNKSNQSPNVVGEKLAVKGSWADRQLPACEQCHGTGGYGTGVNFPALAGQSSVYTIQQLRDWQQNKRSGDANGMMKMVADKLTDDEIQAVASYFEALPFKAEHTQSPESTHKPTTMDSSLPEPKPYKISVPSQGEAPAGRDISQQQKYFTPPAYEAYPDGPFGDVVRSGERIFNETNSHSLSARYVGNEQQCVNCHLDSGRLADSSPMWSAWVAYPAFRKKSNKVNDISLRIQGCFTYSMNAQASKVGYPPHADSQTMINLLSYLYWISKGAPTGDKSMSGRGYPDLAETKNGFDPARGKLVYTQYCTVCHGDNGKGVINAGVTQFPPLWGDTSYNWGAGMHNVNVAAKFIKANMPLGKPNSLSDQDAWDVAAYINSQHRPQDPRHQGNLVETSKKFHASKYDYYGQTHIPDVKAPETKDASLKNE